MELLDYIPTPISAVKDRFAEAKRDPTMMVKATLETVEEITKGKGMLVDASNPAVMLLEFAAIESASCTQESLALLRKQYPFLAMNEEDLYLHMSDEDFLNRFATPPSPGKFLIAIEMNSLINSAVYDETENARKAIIPRDTTIEVDGVCFTLLYPIVIRYYENGTLKISYDPSITNPVYTLKNTILDPVIRQGSSLERWIFFELSAPQVKVESSYFMIDKTYNFRQEIAISDHFYYARVFYKNEQTQGSWLEIGTTHTDQVFDIMKPTAVLKIGTGQVVVEVPVIYTTTGALSGELRVDVYTTKGALSMNLRNYRPDAFVVTMKAIDEKRDLNPYTQAMETISFNAQSLEMVTGGSNPINFESLREQVIYNAVGPQNIPITNVQLEARGEMDGFEIVKNIDILTNRIFLATRRLPAPSQAKLITAANIGMVTYGTDTSDLMSHYKTIVNGHRITIRSKAIWLNQNSRLSLVKRSDLDALQAMGQTAMVSKINTEQYFYTPFYYVLDAEGDEFEIRSYALDQPYAKDQNFVRQNETLQLSVNTGEYQLKKVDSGYELRIKTRSDAYYLQMEDSQVGAQLAFHPKNETAYAYINGVQESVSETTGRVFRFDIKTNHDVDSQNLICITNATVQGITDYKAYIDLETVFEILHYTTSIVEQYRPDETDQLLGKFMLPAGVAGNTHERLTLHLGDALKNLWRRSRSYMTDKIYRRHTVDVPRLYTEDVFDKDPVTGSIFTVVDDEVIYRYLHRAGDPMLTVDGEVVYQYREGDVVLDEHGMPVIDIFATTGREMDLLVVDGRYLFSDDAATASYRDEIETTLVGWITNNVAELQQNLLDRSMIFFYPKTTLGVIQVLTENNGQDYLSAEQSFTVDLYVPYAIYNDLSIRETLRLSTVATLDQAIGKQVINMTQVRESLKKLYGESVTAFNITGLGGDRNYQHIEVASEQNKLCLKKQLVVQPVKSMIVEDAVVVSFKVIK